MIALRLLADGTPLRESVFRADSLLIGRGDDCDFPILDGSVSRRHARICRGEGGAVWIEDAGSRNGLRVAGRRVARAEVDPRTPLRCWLGSVELEIVLAPPDATLEIPVATPRTAHAGRALAAWAAGVAGCLALMTASAGFWSPWELERTSKLSWMAIGAAIGLPITGFLLLGLLRIVGRRAGVGATLSAIATVVWGWLAVGFAGDALAYATPVALHAALSSLLHDAAIVASITFLASVGRRGPMRRFILGWLGALAVLVLGLEAAGRVAQRQTGAPQVDFDVQAPVSGFAGPASGLDTYLQRLRAGFGEAEKRAAEDRRRSDGVDRAGRN